MQHHKYSLTELENMIAWERDVYVSMLIQYIEMENEKIRQQNNSKWWKLVLFWITIKIKREI